jgi:competence protein ComGC
MKRIVLLFISFLLLLFIGCATKEYVKQQVEDCCNKVENCCNKAEAAVKKCEKAFELQQEK